MTKKLLNVKVPPLEKVIDEILTKLLEHDNLYAVERNVEDSKTLEKLRAEINAMLDCVNLHLPIKPNHDFKYDFYGSCDVKGHSPTVNVFVKVYDRRRLNSFNGFHYLYVEFDSDKVDVGNQNICFDFVNDKSWVDGFRCSFTTKQTTVSWHDVTNKPLTQVLFRNTDILRYPLFEVVTPGMKLESAAELYAYLSAQKEVIRYLKACKNSNESPLTS